jgi:transcriptional regulator with XRE-family HTH domain
MDDSAEVLASANADTTAPKVANGIASSMQGELADDELQRLAKRARERRDELSLTRNVVADHLKISAMNLLRWERSLPRRRRPEETEWEQLLKVPEGWLRDTKLSAYPPAPFPESIDTPSTTVASEIRAICSWFSRRNRFGRTTEYEALQGAEKRMVDIMLHRYGVYGNVASTLQHIADRLRITGERVRQIGEEFTGNLDEQLGELPAFTRLKESIQEHLPCKVAELEDRFRPLLGEQLTLSGADAFAREVLGRNIVRVITRPANMQGHTVPMAVPDDTADDAELRAVRQVAVSMVRIAGAAQVHFVAGMSSTTLKRGITPDDVIRCCKMFSNFEWLSEEDGWFWFGPAADNRAKTTAFKLLSVATRNVDVEEIHDAMSRARLMRYDPDRPRVYMIDAPLPVLKEVIKRIPGIETLQYNDFRLSVPVSPNDVLSETELAILDVLKRHGGVANRQVIVDEVLKVLDVTLMGLNFALDGSPIVVRLDTGVWSIRGTRLNTEAVVAALSRNAMR